MPSQHDKAVLFGSLHTPGTPLVLANAWDVASARISEAGGLAAVATTSAGLAWSLGFPDGDELDRTLAMEATARIVAAVDVPVTADIESGYAADAAGVGDTIRAVLAAGAVGINLEDGMYAGDAPLRDKAEQVERIAAARQAADDAQIPLFINARTDPYLRGVGDPAARLAETLDRAGAYLAAGANGIFVPGTTDLDVLAQLTAGIDGPVNVLVGYGSPTVSELARAGVARVSLGSSIAVAAYGLAHSAIREALVSGSYSLLDGSLSYGELNALFAKH